MRTPTPVGVAVKTGYTWLAGCLDAQQGLTSSYMWHEDALAFRQWVCPGTPGQCFHLQNACACQTRLPYACTRRPGEHDLAAPEPIGQPAGSKPASCLGTRHPTAQQPAQLAHGQVWHSWGCARRWVKGRASWTAFVADQLQLSEAVRATAVSVLPDVLTSSLVYAAGWASMPALRVLDLALNQEFTQDLAGWQLPAQLDTLLLQGTGVTGPLPSTLPTTLTCLVVQDSPGVCGPVPAMAPCMEAAGTQLGKSLGLLYSATHHPAMTLLAVCCPRRGTL